MLHRPVTWGGRAAHGPQVAVADWDLPLASEFDADVDMIIVVIAVDDYDDDGTQLRKPRICALCKAGFEASRCDGTMVLCHSSIFYYLSLTTTTTYLRLSC